MQNRIFQSSAKLMHGRNQKTNLAHLYVHLVETFTLILNSKTVFNKLLGLKLLILKKMYYMHLTLQCLVITKGHTY